MKLFVELYVDKFCKEVFMYYVNDCLKEFVKKYVEKVIDLVCSRFIKEEKIVIWLEECYLKDCEQNDIVGGFDSFILNKLWKYLGVFFCEISKIK